MARTFTHEILGFGGTLAALSGFLDAESLDPTIAAVVVGYIGLWVFLSGGILDRLARGRPVRPFCVLRRVRRVLSPLRPPRRCHWTVLLAAVREAAPLALRHVVRPLHARSHAPSIRSSRVRVALYLVFVSLLVAVNLVADFAKVRAVVEDRRSAISALGAALRFIRRRPGACAGALPPERARRRGGPAPLAADGARAPPRRPGSPCWADSSTSWPASGRSWPSWRPKWCSSRASSRTRVSRPRRSPSGRILQRWRRSRTCGDSSTGPGSGRRPGT